MQKIVSSLYTKPLKKNTQPTKKKDKQVCPT